MADMIRDNTVDCVSLYRIKLDRDGYDECGCYYGTGLPVYLAEPNRGLSQAFRAKNIRMARSIASHAYPMARIES